MAEHFGGRPRPRRDPAQRAFQGKGSTKSARNTHRTAAVRAQAGRHHPRGHSDGRPGTGTATGELRVPWITAVAEHPRGAGAGPAELGGGGFAKDDRACRFEPANDRRVLHRHIVQAGERAFGGAQVCGRKQILDAERDAMQRAPVNTGSGLFGQGLRLLQCGLGVHVAKSVECAIVGFDRFQAGFDQLHWRQHPFTNTRSCVDDGWHGQWAWVELH